jgi:hypothetical protein
MQNLEQARSHGNKEIGASTKALCIEQKDVPRVADKGLDVGVHDCLDGVWRRGERSVKPPNEPRLGRNAQHRDAVLFSLWFVVDDADKLCNRISAQVVVPEKGAFQRQQQLAVGDHRCKSSFVARLLSRDWF